PPDGGVGGHRQRIVVPGVGPPIWSPTVPPHGRDATGRIGQPTGPVPPSPRGPPRSIGVDRPRLRDGHVGLTARDCAELPLVALLPGIALADLPAHAHDASSVLVLSPGKVGGGSASALSNPSMATCICAENPRAPDRVASRSRSRASSWTDTNAEAYSSSRAASAHSAAHSSARIDSGRTR